MGSAAEEAGGGRTPEFGGKFFNIIRPQILTGFVLKFLTL